MSDRTFNLADFWQTDFDYDLLATHPQTIRLARLNLLAQKTFDTTKSYWFGIYKKYLVRESYWAR